MELLIPFAGMGIAVIAIILSHKKSMAKLKLQAENPVELKNWQRDRKMILERLENIEYLYTAKDHEWKAEIAKLHKKIATLSEEEA